MLFIRVSPFIQTRSFQNVVSRVVHLPPGSKTSILSKTHFSSRRPPSWRSRQSSNPNHLSLEQQKLKNEIASLRQKVAKSKRENDLLYSITTNIIYLSGIGAFLTFGVGYRLGSE
ncbi:MAG: hypothetical protein S4CHLAM20_05640 [Chlamydiia bacterium]|nr:hypothetical protein [Chlamydiia bacterium]